MDSIDDSQIMENSAYNSLRDDMEALLKLVDTYVKVIVIKNCSFSGFVHSIDPITLSIILSVPQEDAYETVLIPGHAILDVTKEPTPDNVRLPTRKDALVYSPEIILKRRTKLLSWFKLNLLPVSELDDIIVIGDARILPPYDTLDLYTDNPIVLMQIKKIIESMPEDYEPT